MTAFIVYLKREEHVLQVQRCVIHAILLSLYLFFFNVRLVLNQLAIGHVTLSQQRQPRLPQAHRPRPPQAQAHRPRHRHQPQLPQAHRPRHRPQLPQAHRPRPRHRLLHLAQLLRLLHVFHPQ